MLPMCVGGSTSPGGPHHHAAHACGGPHHLGVRITMLPMCVGVHITMVAGRTWCHMEADFVLIYLCLSALSVCLIP